MGAPELFARLSLADARSAAQGKWLLIDFTAEWCAPCQHMDKTTWVDPQVMAWMKEKAIAVQIDVDHDPAARQFGIQAMPTVVALRDDAEVDRIIGARSPAQLLEWLGGLEQGKTELDRAREGIGDDLAARFKLGQTLLMRGATDEAMEQFMWLWDNALRIEPAWVGVRHSYLIRAMDQAAGASAGARATLTALRDAAPRGSHDWRSLNNALKDSARTLAWFDETKAAGGAVDDAHDVRELLRAYGRWKDLGELVKKPVEQLVQLFQNLERMDTAAIPPEMLGPLRDHLRDSTRTEAAHLLRALKAAGREDDARAVAEEARRRDPSEAMSAALNAMAG
jgi:thiol-disulfide isomerase/thioredoxin